MTEGKLIAESLLDDPIRAGLMKFITPELLVFMQSS